MVYSKDATIGDGETAKVHPRVNGGTTLEKQLASFGIEGIEHGSIGIASPLLVRQDGQLSVVDSTALSGLPHVFSVGDRKDDAVGDGDRLRHVEVTRSPSWFQGRFLGIAVHPNVERHYAAMRIWAVGLGKLGNLLREGPQDRNIEPRPVLLIPPGRKTTPDSRALESVLIVGETRRDVESVRISGP